jgi:phospholipid/cholesterol/gamma-HCH transport system substrate-binding protein
MRFNTDRLRLELGRSIRPLAWLAVLATFAVVAGYVIFNNITFTSPWASSYQVRIAVSDAKGITAGQQVVKIAGVDVGVVKQVQLTGAAPVLTLSLKPQYGPLYRDASFRLRPLTPLEDLYVSIESRGTKAAGVLHDNEIVNANQTVTPVDIGEVLNTFQPDTRAAMAVTLNELARGAPDNGVNLRAAFVQLSPFLTVAQRTLGAVADRRRELAELTARFSSLLGAVGARDRQLVQLIGSGEQSLGELARYDAPFAQTLAQLPPTMTAMRQSFATLRTSEDTLDPALSSLQPVAARLATGLTALQSVAGAANPALTRLRPALTALAPLAQQLRPTAASLTTAFARLQPQAPAFDHITALIPPCFDWISRFFNDTLSVFKFSDAYGTIPRGNNTVDYSTVGGTGTATLSQPTPCTGASR